MATSVPVPTAMPEVGLGQGRGVVDAVADHGDDPALLLQAAHDGGLVRGQHLGDDLVDARPRAATARAAAALSPVSSTGRRPRPRRRRDRLGARRADGVGDDQQRPHLAVPGHGDRRAARRPARARAPPRRRSSRARPRSASRAGRPTTTRVAVDDALDAEALAVGEALGRRQRAELGAGRRGDRAGDRVLGAVLQRAREAQGLRRGRRRRPATTSTSAIAPVGDGAGLVEHDGVDAARRLEHLGAADEDPELGAAAGADQQRRRRGEAERAGAGDDQHRDRGA